MTVRIHSTLPVTICKVSLTHDIAMASDLPREALNWASDLIDLAVHGKFIE